MNYRLATPTDIPGLLSLQQRYLVTNLSAEAQKNGFVTTPFSEKQVMDLIKLQGIYVAIYENELIAYLCAGAWDYFSQWPIFPYMVNRLRHLSFLRQSLAGVNTFQYGPVCIDETWRGQGVLQHLFEVMRQDFSSKYPISITFINKVNKRSINAHLDKLHWKIIDEFIFNERHYYLLAFDMSYKVLEDTGLKTTS